MSAEYLELGIDRAVMEAEMSALGAAMLRPDSLETVIIDTKEADYSLASHKAIYRSLKDCYTDFRKADLISVRDMLDEEGRKYVTSDLLIQAMDTCPSAINVAMYTASVTRNALKRALAALPARFASLRDIEDPEDARRALLGIVGDISEFGTTASIYTDTSENVQSAYRGVPSPWKLLDEASGVGGLPLEELTLVEAATGTGKTLILCQIAEALIEDFDQFDEAAPRVLYISLEMSRQQLMGRILGLRTGWNGSPANINNLEFAAAYEAERVRLSKSNWRVFSTKHIGKFQADLDRITQWVHEQGREAPIKAILIDYLTLISTPGIHHIYAQVDQIAIRCIELARRYKCPAILASQLKDDANYGGDKPGHHAYLRLRTVKDKDGTTNIVVAKAREGKTGKLDIVYDPNTKRYV